MTNEQAASFVFANAVAAMIELEGMKAENVIRTHRLESPAYVEDDFVSLIDSHELGYNTIHKLFAEGV